MAFERGLTKVKCVPTKEAFIKAVFVLELSFSLELTSWRCTAHTNKGAINVAV